MSALHFSVTSKQLISTSEDCMIVAWDIRSNRLEVILLVVVVVMSKLIFFFDQTPEWVESDFCQRCNRPFFWNLKAMYDQKTLGFRQVSCCLVDVRHQSLINVFNSSGSITAAAVARQSAMHAVCIARLCPRWASSFRCECATTASPTSPTPSKLIVEVVVVFDVRLISLFQPLTSRVSMAKFYDSKHCINGMNIDETNKLMVTAGFDRVIKVSGPGPSLFFLITNPTSSHHTAMGHKQGAVTTQITK